MSNHIQGRGKQKFKHGQDLSTNSMSMGGGQMAMPPNGVAPFATPIVPHENYTRLHTVEIVTNSHMSGPHGGPALQVPQGMHVQHETPSAYAMGLPPQNNRNSGGINPNMVWTGVPQQPAQQPMMNPTMGGHPNMMNRGGAPQQPQQGRPTYPTQQPQPQPQPMGGYFAPPATGGYPYMAPQGQPVYAYQTQEQAYMQAQNQAAYLQAQQQQQFYQQNQQNQQMIAQQQPQQHMQQSQQHPTGQQMLPPTSMHQQQGGGGVGGVPSNQHQQQMHGGQVPPVSGPPQPMHPGGVMPVSAPTDGSQQPIRYNNPMAFRPPQQEQQPRQAAPIAAKKKNILAIVNPDDNTVVNQNAVEASKKEEEDAPKATEKVEEEKEGTDETDHAVAANIKAQFAEQIQEKSAKSEQPAPAPTPAAAPVSAASAPKKILFSDDQLAGLTREGVIVKPHVPAPPTYNPSGISGPSVPLVAATAVEEKKEKETEKKKEDTVETAVPVVAVSEYLPDPLPAPAYPNNYKEKQAKEAKEASPNTTLSEMPSTNHYDHPDGSHLLTPETTPPHEEPASSSSEKNPSNDSAISVTPPHPSKETEKEKEDVVVEESLPEITADVEEEEEKTAAEPEDEEAEDLSTKLDQLVIAEPTSQDEEESEPSTPAPVTPSVSETTTALAEEDEDAEKAAAAAEEAAEEARQQKRAELEAAIAANMEDESQFKEDIGRYNREYLYNVRDIEKLFALTDCPLTSQQLKEFGICRSQASGEGKKKQDGQAGFMPQWGMRQGGGGGGGGPRSDRKPYQGRQSEQHHRGGGGGGGPRQGSNKKLPPSIRPSIERRVETNVQLHKAEQAWKPEKVTEANAEDEEVKKKLLLKNIRALFNKITPTTKDSLINEFLNYKVYESPSLNEVISIIFDKAVEEPKFCPLYANMCITQVTEELKVTHNVSNFRNAILFRAQDTFTNKNMEEDKQQKEDAIAAETDEKKKRDKQIELLEAMNKFRRRKFGNITFIGQLYLQNLISVRIILFCVFDLLKSVTEKPADLTGYEADEESVDCAVRLLETIGKRLQEYNNQENKNTAAAAEKNKKVITRPGQPTPPPAAKPQQSQAFPLEGVFTTLDTAIPIVSSRIKFMIMNLSELRKNNWTPRKTADAGPKKLDEIKNDMKKEALENAHQQQQYERKQSRQEGGMGGRGQMGGGGGYGGGGGGGGGHGGNPKRQIIGRGSNDNRGTAEERRSQAHKSSNLAPRAAPLKKASLSSVTGTERASLGGTSKNKWSGGASGGSENSKKEDRAAAIQSTSRFMTGQRSSSSASMKGAEDDGANASGNATQVNSEDEREQNEQREKQEAEITKRLVGTVGDYSSGEITLDEARDELLGTTDLEKFSKPSLQTVAKCFMTAAIKKATKEFDTAPKAGYVLAYSLLKKTEEKDAKGREEILKGVADSCKDIVEQEQWDDNPKIWSIVAEVLINAHVPEEGIFEGAHPTLVDFKDTFLNAAKDGRKPYSLFVLVLKRLAEKHYKRDKDSYMEVMSWVLDECEKITKHMDAAKLNKALTETEMSWEKNLHDILRH